MNMITAILIYITIISAITLLCFGIDKWKAKNQRWRIKEATLISLCIIGGSIGGLAGMHIFHHKTKKPLFFIGIPLILIVQIAIIIICLIHMNIIP